MDIQIQKPDCEFEKNLKFLYYHIKDDYLREKEEINKKISKLSSLLNVLVTALGIFILLCVALSMIIDNCKAIICIMMIICIAIGIAMFIIHNKIDNLSYRRIMKCNEIISNKIYQYKDECKLNDTDIQLLLILFNKFLE